HVADHGDREAEGEIGDQVHAAAGFDAVDDPVDDLLNARAHILDAAGRKGAHHEPTQAGVVGRILLQHPVAHAAVDRLLENLRAVAPAHPAGKILAETLIAQDGGDVGMPAGNIEAERREVHGGGFTQPLVVRIRIGNELRRQRIEERRACDRLYLLVHGRSPWIRVNAVSSVRHAIATATAVYRPTLAYSRRAGTEDRMPARTGRTSERSLTPRGKPARGARGVPAPRLTGWRGAALPGA